ncbi:hypothetical protein D3C84_890490 [compost metagenome]
MTDTDIDELRVQQYLAEVRLQRGHGRLRVARPGQADRLGRDHLIGRAGQRLLQVPGTADRQDQPRIGGQRRQLCRCLAGTALHLAAVGVDRLQQLRLFARHGSGGKHPTQRQRGEPRHE